MTDYETILYVERREAQPLAEALLKDMVAK
jgi:hypothetical protein